jgi:hypothetical protein
MSDFAAVHESGIGTNATSPTSAATSAFGGKAENICSLRALSFVTPSGPSDLRPHLISG